MNLFNFLNKKNHNLYAKNTFFINFVLGIFALYCTAKSADGTLCNSMAKNSKQRPLGLTAALKVT